MLGQKYGYYPKDIMKAYKCDSMIDAYLDIVGKIYKPFFLPEDKREAEYPNIFGKLIPRFLDQIEEQAGKAEFLCGDDLTIADFWIGGLYTNYINNPHVGFAKESWEAALDTYPNFKAYGERFKKEMASYLEKRDPMPI